MANSVIKTKNVIEVSTNIRKIFLIVSATTGDIATVAQQIIDSINTDGKITIFEGIVTYGGNKYFSGYVYPNKDFGNFTLSYWTRMYDITIDNSVIDVHQLV